MHKYPIFLSALSVLLFLSASIHAAETVAWKTSWDEAAKAAKKSSKNILLLFTNPERCPPCRMMEESTWPDAAVVKFVNANFVPLKIHTDQSKERDLGNEFRVMGIPTTVVTNPDKDTVARTAGFAPPNDFLDFLEAAAAIKKLEKAVKAAPEKLDAVFDLAKAYTDLDRKTDAAPLLEKVCALDKDNAAKKKLVALYLLGTIAFQNNDIEEAKKKFLEVSKLDPDNKSEYADDNALQLAILPANERNFAAAAARLRKFANTFPKSEYRPEALFILGRCHLMAEDAAAAAKALEELIKDYPDSRPAEYAKRILADIKRNGNETEQP